LENKHNSNNWLCVHLSSYQVTQLGEFFHLKDKKKKCSSYMEIFEIMENQPFMWE
jgi:hypothetical protein